LSIFASCGKEAHDWRTADLLVNCVLDSGDAIRRRAALVLARLMLPPLQVDDDEIVVLAASARAVAEVEGADNVAAAQSITSKRIAEKATAQVCICVVHISVCMCLYTMRSNEGAAQRCVCNTLCNTLCNTNCNTHCCTERRVHVRARVCTRACAGKERADAGDAQAADAAAAAASVTAHIERNQAHSVQLSKVIQMIVTHTRSRDVSVCSSALSTLALLMFTCDYHRMVDSSVLVCQLVKGGVAPSVQCGATRMEIAAALCGGGGGGDDVDTDVHMTTSFEGMLLMCELSDIEQLQSTAGMPRFFNYCLDAVVKLCNDLPRRPPADSRTGAGLPGRFVRGAEIFRCNSLEQVHDLIQSRLIGLLRMNETVLTALVPKQQSTNKARLAEETAKSEGAVDMQTRHAASRWMAVLALKRCALWATAQHLALNPAHLGVGATAAAANTWRTDGQIEEHALFHGSGGGRLKSVVMAALVQVMLKEPHHTVRTAAAGVLLDLCPEGGTLAFSNLDKDNASDTVMHAVLANMHELLHADQEQIAHTHKTLAAEERTRKQKENAVSWGAGDQWATQAASRSTQRPADVVAREIQLVQQHVRLLADLGALRHYDVLECARLESAAGAAHSALHTPRSAQAHSTLMGLIQGEGTSQYAVAEVRMQAVRALSYMQQGRASSKTW